MEYLWVGIYLAAVRSEIRRWVLEKGFKNSPCEPHCFYRDNFIRFLISRPSTTCETMLGKEVTSSEERRLTPLCSVGDSW